MEESNSLGLEGDPYIPPVWQILVVLLPWHEAVRLQVAQVGHGGYHIDWVAHNYKVLLDVEVQAIWSVDRVVCLTDPHEVVIWDVALSSEPHHRLKVGPLEVHV